jgi:transposase
MKPKRIYRTESVEQVRISDLLPHLVSGCIVAMDVAKAKFVVALMTLAGRVLTLFRFEHPTETRKFLALVADLRRGAGDAEVRVVMEPTGTYGDAIRYQLSQGGVAVHRVSPKRVHDYREVLDGVPSMHDPKSATIVAELAQRGMSREWPQTLESHARLRALVDLRSFETDDRERSASRLEALLARHWPEFGAWLDLREQKTACKVLVEFRGPAGVCKEPARTRGFLEAASRRRLSVEAIDGIIESASSTLGVPMTEEEASLVVWLATRLLEATNHIEKIDADITHAGKSDDGFASLAPWMGAYSAAVIVTHCDPRQYANPKQLEKACGLNLREKSSGEHNGRLSITKRGPGVVRQVLYLFALRMLQSSKATSAWYKRRVSHREDSKKRAVVAVMRKLVRAIFHVARGHAFDETKLFDTRRLDLGAASAIPRTSFEPRTMPRSIVRGRKRGGATASAST